MAFVPRHTTARRHMKSNRSSQMCGAHGGRCHKLIVPGKALEGLPK